MIQFSSDCHGLDSRLQITHGPGSRAMLMTRIQQRKLWCARDLRASLANYSRMGAARAAPACSYPSWVCSCLRPSWNSLSLPVHEEASESWLRDQQQQRWRRRDTSRDRSGEKFISRKFILRKWIIIHIAGGERDGIA
jgi:hypothetical protein